MLEAHPIADLFPMMEGAAFDDLVASIREHGLLSPIALVDDKILDGRNRYRACLEADVAPLFEIMDCDDPEKWVAFVEAQNLHRRHLTNGQRAAIAGRLVSSKVMSTEKAAIAMNVPPRAAAKAAVVHRHGNADVIEMMERGKLSIDKAHRIATGIVGSDGAPLRRERGRPIGKSSVNKLRRVLDDLDDLSLKTHELIMFWPADPQLNHQFAKASSFLTSLLLRTREYGDPSTHP